MKTKFNFKKNRFNLHKKTVILAMGITLLGLTLPLLSKKANSFDIPIQFISVQAINSQIMASGSVISKNQVALHFQTSGKLVYLPVNEGDSVYAGQEIAGLDSLESQKNVTAAEAALRSAQSAKDLVIDNIHLFQYGNGGFPNVGTANETQTQKTQRQQSEEVVNMAYDNLQKAKKELENTVLNAPFDATVIHEDITATGVNVTPANTFLIADLNKLVFQSQVSDSDIYSVNEGDHVLIQLDGMNGKQLDGVISKIYPEKIKLTSGGDGFKVDVESGGLQNTKLGTAGSIIIQKSKSGILVPSWTVLGNQYVWVFEGNDLNPKLKTVRVGETVGGKTEVLDGLSQDDKVIINPKTIVNKKYQII